jgi:endonuclease/exonuclease/phosphatase family metal-dependent hydrolase
MPADPHLRLLRIVTWNVHACVGGDGRFDPDRVVAIVRGLSPDIVALQEVEARRSRTGGLDVFAFLREQVLGHTAEARTITTADGDYGHMVLSRWPLHATRVHDISVAGREPRGIADATALAPFGPIRVIGAHFGLDRRERRKQTAALRAIVGSGPDGAAIVAGDFNELRRRSATHRALSPEFQGVAPVATFPSRRPMFALDRIWCRPPLSVRHSRVLPGARAASDHLPLIAELDWVETSSPASLDGARSDGSF